MLVGKNPWCEPSMSDEMYREFTQSPEFFSNHFGFDQEIEGVLRGCLETDAGKRWGIDELCDGVEQLINAGGPDSAVEMGEWRERVTSWASEAMDFNEAPVFDSDVDIGVFEIEDVGDEEVNVEHDEANKGKRRKRRHRKDRKDKGKHEKEEAEGMMIEMAAAFSKMLTPEKKVEVVDEGGGLGGFRMTFL
jgi:hypothetical protein